MTDKDAALQFGRQLIDDKLNILGIKRGTKDKPIPPDWRHSWKWKDFQTKPITPEGLENIIACSEFGGFILINGLVSGQLVTLDFEAKDVDDNPMECCFPKFKQIALARLGEFGLLNLFDLLSIVSSQSKGVHVRYKVDTTERLDSQSLAYMIMRDADGQVIMKDGAPFKSLIVEVLAEGKYGLIPPCPGYKEIQGSLLKIPRVPIGVHRIFLSILKGFDEQCSPETSETTRKSQSKTKADARRERGDLLPGDDYNQRGDDDPELNHRTLLEKHGWRFVSEDAEKELYRRPGKDEGHSAQWTFLDFGHGDRILEANRFFSFTPHGAPISEGRGYDLFGLYTTLEHKGDISAATKALAARGYGSQNQDQWGTVEAPGHAHYESKERSEPEPEPEPEHPPPKQIRLPELAWRGKFEIYRHALKSATEACDAFHFAVFKTIAGTIVGRCAYLYSGAHLYPNFYTTLIGPTKQSRKSTAMRFGVNLLRNVDSTVINLRGLATPEGLIAMLQQRDEIPIEDEIGNARNDQISEHEGYRLLATINELASLLKKAKKESSSGLIQCLTDAYDCPASLDNPTRHSPLRAENPFVSMIALSTKEWLERSLDVDDIHGGFVNRFCFYLHEPTGPIPRPNEPDQKALSYLVQKLHECRERFQGEHIKFTFDEDAGTVYDAWYIENWEKQHATHIIDQAAQRIDINTLKLALLYAVLENPDGDYQIHLDQLEAAIEVGRYWETTVTEIFGTFATSEKSKNDQRVIDRLTKKPSTKRELQRYFGSSFPADDLNKTLDALRKIGAIKPKEGGVLYVVE